MTTPRFNPAAIPDAYFDNWDPITVNKFLRRQSKEDQLSIAIAALRWAQEGLPADSPAADLLAGAQEEITQALPLLPPEQP